MAQVVLTEWQPGLQKVQLTRLIQSSTGLPFRQAKDCVDRFLEGEAVQFALPTEAAAAAFSTEAERLGARVGRRDEERVNGE